MVMLAASASGTQHVRWGKQVSAALSAYLAVTQERRFEALLPDTQRAAIAAERRALSPFIIGLEAANAEYRSFRESAEFETRALERIGELACAGFRAARDMVGAPLRDRLDETEHTMASRLALLYASMRRSCADLRDALEGMDERLRELVGERVVDSLYPELSEAWAAQSEDDEVAPTAAELVFTH